MPIGGATNAPTVMPSPEPLMRLPMERPVEKLETIKSFSWPANVVLPRPRELEALLEVGRTQLGDGLTERAAVVDIVQHGVDDLHEPLRGQLIDMAGQRGEVCDQLTGQGVSVLLLRVLDPFVVAAADLDHAPCDLFVPLQGEPADFAIQLPGPVGLVLGPTRPIASALLRAPVWPQNQIENGQLLADRSIHDVEWAHRGAESVGRREDAGRRAT